MTQLNPLGDEVDPVRKEVSPSTGEVADRGRSDLFLAESMFFHILSGRLRLHGRGCILAWFETPTPYTLNSAP